MNLENNPRYKDLMNQYENINEFITDEIENLKYLLENQLISDINLINIHYRIHDLILKRNNITNEIYDEFQIIIIDEI